jgi:hypothetical protein
VVFFPSFPLSLSLSLSPSIVLSFISEDVLTFLTEEEILRCLAGTLKRADLFINEYQGGGNNDLLRELDGRNGLF